MRQRWGMVCRDAKIWRLDALIWRLYNNLRSDALVGHLDSLVGHSDALVGPLYNNLRSNTMVGRLYGADGRQLDYN
jgi:hypothetical protein